MFLGLEWHKWLVIIAALAVCIPFKVKFMRGWAKRQQEKKKEPQEKWGNDE